MFKRTPTLMLETRWPLDKLILLHCIRTVNDAGANRFGAVYPVGRHFL